ncbi:MAG: histidine kinase [Bacteroidota bacterium]
MKIQGKLTLALALFGLLLILAMALPFYRESSRTLERQQHQLLETVLDSRIESIHHTMELRRQQAQQIARTWMPARIVPREELDEELRSRLIAHLTGIVRGDTDSTRTLSDFAPEQAGIDQLSIRDLDGDLLVRSDTDSRAPSDRLPKGLLEELQKNGEAVRSVWRGTGSENLRLLFYQEVRNADTHEQSAFLEMEIRIEGLNRIVLDRTGMGESGEVLLFAEREDVYRLVTPLRHTGGSEGSSGSGDREEIGRVLELTDTDLVEGVRKGVAARAVRDYRQVEVRCEWASVPELGWIVAAKIDRDELYVPMSRMNRVVGWSVAGVLLFALLLAWAMARSLSEPIRKLTTLFKRISRGEAVQPVRVEREDELGELAQRANDSIHYLNRIRHHANRIAGGDPSGNLKPVGPEDRLGKTIVAMTSSIRRYRIRIARLLRESRRQTRRLSAQREEIRQELVMRRKLQQRLLEVHDRERQQVGRELHDGLGQMLTGIRMLSEQLASRLRKQGEASAESVAEISGMVREADEFVRVLSRGMALHDVGSTGLDPLLRNLCDNMEKLFGIQPTLEIEGDLKLENSVAMAVYRIVQEGVTNAVRHADPDWIQVEVCSEGDQIRFQVRNNGIAFRESNRRNGGLGLQTMEYRASVLGGFLRIESETDGITRVFGEIPCKQYEETE